MAFWVSLFVSTTVAMAMIAYGLGREVLALWFVVQVLTMILIDLIQDFIGGR